MRMQNFSQKILEILDEHINPNQSSLTYMFITKQTNRAKINKKIKPNKHTPENEAKKCICSLCDYCCHNCKDSHQNTTNIPQHFYKVKNKKQTQKKLFPTTFALHFFFDFYSFTLLRKDKRATSPHTSQTNPLSASKTHKKIN